MHASANPDLRPFASIPTVKTLFTANIKPAAVEPVAPYWLITDLITPDAGETLDFYRGAWDDQAYTVWCRAYLCPSGQDHPTSG